MPKSLQVYVYDAKNKNNYYFSRGKHKLADIIK